MTNQKGWTLVELVAAIWALIVLAFAGACIYVAWHFISKLW